MYEYELLGSKKKIRGCNLKTAVENNGFKVIDISKNYDGTYYVSCEGNNNLRVSPYRKLNYYEIYNKKTTFICNDCAPACRLELYMDAKKPMSCPFNSDRTCNWIKR